MIDSEGYRPNVGIILCNQEQRLFWGRRVGQNAWQFPQGGIEGHESPEEAMFRELKEEVGLLPHQVDLMGVTENWLRYRLPKRYGLLTFGVKNLFNEEFNFVDTDPANPRFQQEQQVFVGLTVSL